MTNALMNFKTQKTKTSVLVFLCLRLFWHNLSMVLVKFETMKKILLFTIGVCTSLYANAQKNTKELPNSVIKIEVANTVEIDESLSIELVKVLSDSRCPKNVQCVWAGEAQLLVNIYKKGQKVQQEKLTIHPTAVQENVLQLVSSKLTKTTAINLWPYPNGIDKVELGNYCLELTVSH